MRLELSNPTATLLDEIGNPKIKQADVAVTYALAVRQGFTSSDWAAVNEAIVNRWSRSGLERIKRLAWKRVEAAHG